nr:unnamed protein product [Callosobruchus analis]
MSVEPKNVKNMIQLSHLVFTLSVLQTVREQSAWSSYRDIPSAVDLFANRQAGHQRQLCTSASAGPCTVSP